MTASGFLSKTLRRTSGVIAILGVVLTAFTASAQDNRYQWDVDFDEDKKPWNEIEAKVPPYPKPENLLPFALATYSPHRFFVDVQSLSLGGDGVMRYVLVINTAGGATNVTFEGMRCETRQQKYYAVGQAQGGWVRARNPQWRQIGKQDTGQHGVLFDGYFCINPLYPTTPKEAIWQLKYGGGARFGGPMAE